MGTRRLLFVRPSRRASLVPIYAALLLVASLGLAGLGLGMWLDPPAPSAQQQDDRHAGPKDGPVNGALNAPVSPPRIHGTWM